jgi:hypothetical protein
MVGPAVNAVVGATLTTVTPLVAVFPGSPSESVAWAVTWGEAGPSRNQHVKLPEVSVLASLTLVPPVPQEVLTLWTVSTPGSEIE